MTGAATIAHTTTSTNEFAFWNLAPADAHAALTARYDSTSTQSEHTQSGRHVVARRRLGIVGRQFISPVTLILIIAALIAAVSGDVSDGTIILLIVLSSAGLGAWQEGRAAQVVSLLLASVTVTVTVERDGKKMTVNADAIRPGDHLDLSAGDLIPDDCLLISSNDLTVDESALTGESFPVSKTVGGSLPTGTVLAQRTNSLFAGTHVVSGTANAIVMLTGTQTAFGAISAVLRKRAPSTSFEVGIHKFGVLLLRIMLILVAVILVINLLLHRSLLESLLFALALAVGITPQMLPVVVSVSLAVGARKMARSKVIIKRLDVIEDLGAMSILCTDKTGTITVGSVTIERAVDTTGATSIDCLALAVLNAGLQTGYKNPIDAAVLSKQPLPRGSKLIQEIPYDFQRKRLSVVTLVDGVPTLITKGDLQSVMDCCTQVAAAAGAAPMGPVRESVHKIARDLGAQGLRIIAVASRPVAVNEVVRTAESEKGLTLSGLLSFHDPVKPDADRSIQTLTELGIRVKVITGDNRYVTSSLIAQVTALKGRIVLGEELDDINDAALRTLVSENDLFAEVEPLHKIKIVRALHRAGETVGFLGDGINDAGALHAADVGISVDTAVDVAKEAAAIVLLDKDLSVVATGVRLGRRTFSNTLKYVRVAASANFGNILSMVFAAAILPFLPMLPAQILLLNFLADIPNTLISRDHVDNERITKAGGWDMRMVTRFMISFGALSTVFDLATFAIMSWGFHADATLFHSGWFVESAITQFVAVMTLRLAQPPRKTVLRHQYCGGGSHRDSSVQPAGSDPELFPASAPAPRGALPCGTGVRGWQ
jgi:Mg2+-importing ATPase